jgi:hypothetical protein
MANDIVKVAVYDNPATGNRELWQNGQLYAWVSEELISNKDWDFEKKALQRYGYGFAVLGQDKDEWENGRIIGDKEAIAQT